MCVFSVFILNFQSLWPQNQCVRPLQSAKHQEFYKNIRTQFSSIGSGKKIQWYEKILRCILVVRVCVCVREGCARDNDDAIILITKQDVLMTQSADTHTHTPVLTSFYNYICFSINLRVRFSDDYQR